MTGIDLSEAQPRELFSFFPEMKLHLSCDWGFLWGRNAKSSVGERVNWKVQQQSVKHDWRIKGKATHTYKHTRTVSLWASDWPTSIKEWSAGWVYLLRLSPSCRLFNFHFFMCSQIYWLAGGNLPPHSVGSEQRCLCNPQALWGAVGWLFPLFFCLFFWKYRHRQVSKKCVLCSNALWGWTIRGFRGLQMEFRILPWQNQNNLVF